MQNSREVKPPKCGRPPGRPRSIRRRDRDEGGNNRKYMCGRCYVYGHNRSTCKGASAEEQHQAPETYTGPHVRPNPSTRPPPPLASADETTAAPAPRGYGRGRGRGGRGTRKGKGGATHASTSNVAPSVPPTSEPALPTTGGRGRGGRGTRKGKGGATHASTSNVAPSSNIAPSVPPTSEPALPTTSGRGRGGRGTRGGRGGATAPVPLTIITPPVPPVQVAASTTITFGRGVGNSSTNSRVGVLRGRGARGRARGKMVHKRNGRIVGVGILQDEGPTLTREPTPVQVNPIPGTDGCLLRGNYGGRGGGLVMRGGGAFSSTSGRGKRPRMMDWFGTPEQWANEETLP
ncbi:hypothetical protein MKW92_036614 [Papaver armeniacum]|nr:hypothetical protein MKW92_036614 [Papaver armeniacum]